MFCRGILILTLTLLVSVEAETSTNITSSFITCYYNDTSDQCPPGEKCTIVPPDNIIVRRLTFYTERDSSWVNLGGQRRRKRGSGSRSSKISSRKSSSYASSSGGSTGWRFGNSISRSSYGTSSAGITSSPARFARSFYWFSRPSSYYRYRQDRDDIDDLSENQGICVNEDELRTMTQQDCYNWCMSLKYNDNQCAIDCGLTEKENTYYTIMIALAVVALVLVCGFGAYKCLKSNKS